MGRSIQSAATTLNAIRRALFGLMVAGICLSGCASSRHEKEQLIEAAGENNVATMQKLVHSGVDPNSIALEGWTPLTRSAWQGNLEAMSFLIQSGVNPDAPDGNGKTALHYAGLSCHEAAWDFLVAHGASSLGDDGSRAYLERQVVRCDTSLQAKIQKVQKKGRMK